VGLQVLSAVDVDVGVLDSVEAVAAAAKAKLRLQDRDAGGAGIVGTAEGVGVISVSGVSLRLSAANRTGWNLKWILMMKCGLGIEGRIAVVCVMKVPGEWVLEMKQKRHWQGK